MQFTEHELTVAVTGAAKSLMAGKTLRRRGVDIDTAWNTMDSTQRFQLLDTVGSQVLPVLVALPDVEVAPGARPSYSTRQIKEVVASQVPDDRGRLRRSITIKARTALVRTALAHLPPRLEPNKLDSAEEL